MSIRLANIIKIYKTTAISFMALSFCLCLVVQSAHASGGTMSAAGLPTSQFSTSQSGQVQNYNLDYPENKKETPMMMPMGGGSGGGQSRFEQSAPAPPAQQACGTCMPPTGPPFSQPAETASANMGTTGGNAAMSSSMYSSDNLPVTNAQANIMFNAALDKHMQKMLAPDRMVPIYQEAAQALSESAANSVGESGQLAFSAAAGSIAGMSGGMPGASGGDGGDLNSLLDAIAGMPSPGLINVANEAAGVPGSSLLPFKTIPQAVWMVQQMYKHFSIPMAVLLLLPGAIIVQVKAQVAANFNLKAEDATSPFEGILRAMVAVFLIPATQLIVSYSIDVGNSLAYSVNPAVSIMPIIGWLQQVAYSTSAANNDNVILPPNEEGGGAELEQSQGDGGGPGMGGIGGLTGFLGGMGGGLAAGESDDQSHPEQQSSLSSTLENMFNVFIYMFSTGMLVMTAFQLVIMCYLFLLGPIAAAFFAWPTVQGKLFRSVFGNWCNAVIVVSLWRFYWMVILAIMTNRLLNLGENGSMLFNLQWEVAIFTCLIGLMFYIPMNPWDFDPGKAYNTATSFGQRIMESAGGGGKGGGGGGGGGGGEGGGGKEDGGKDGGKSDGKDNAAKSASPVGSMSPASEHGQGSAKPGSSSSLPLNLVDASGERDKSSPSSTSASENKNSPMPGMGMNASASLADREKPSSSEPPPLNVAGGNSTGTTNPGEGQGVQPKTESPMGAGVSLAMNPQNAGMGADGRQSQMDVPNANGNTTNQNGNAPLPFLPADNINQSQKVAETGAPPVSQESLHISPSSDQLAQAPPSSNIDKNDNNLRT